MKNTWVDNGNRKGFAIAIRKLIFERFGINQIKHLTTKQLSKITDEVKKLYHQHGCPPINKFSEIDDIY